MAEADAYVLPIDHGAVAVLRRIFVISTGIRHWSLVVNFDDSRELAGDDPVKRAAFRKMQGSPGAGLLYRIHYVAADLKKLDDVVRRHNGGRLSVESHLS